MMKVMEAAHPNTAPGRPEYQYVWYSRLVNFELRSRAYSKLSGGGHLVRVSAWVIVRGKTTVGAGGDIGGSGGQCN